MYFKDKYININLSIVLRGCVIKKIFLSETSFGG